MVVVFRIGRVPTEYSASVISMAFIVTVALYLAAIIFPFLLSGWSLNFFTPLEVHTERPVVRAKPNVEFVLTGKDTSFGFKVSQSQAQLSTAEKVRVPVIKFPREKNDRFLQMEVHFPMESTEQVTKVAINIPFSADFIEMNRVFNSSIHDSQETFMEACGLDLHGSLIFQQDRALNNNRYIDVPVSQEYYDYTNDKNVPTNSSDPSVGGRPLFIARNVLWHYGTGCSSFALQVSMRVPLTTVVIEREGWYSFLDGWTQYISIAVPLVLIVWMALEGLFKSGFVPIHEEHAAQLETAKIPKFNR